MIINCLGLGARSVISDSQLFPIRGVLIKLNANEHTDILGKAFLFDDDPQGMTYILPRPDGIYIGGKHPLQEKGQKKKKRNATNYLTHMFILYIHKLVTIYYLI